jgi:hypothetical protein
VIALTLIGCVDRAAAEGPRGRPRESDLLEQVVVTALAWLVAAAAWVAMAVLVACVFAGRGISLACRSATGGVHRMGRLVHARSSPRSEGAGGG